MTRLTIKSAQKSANTPAGLVLRDTRISLIPQTSGSVLKIASIHLSVPKLAYRDEYRL